MNRQLLTAIGMNPDYWERVIKRIREKAAQKRARLEARKVSLVRRVEALDREIALLGNGKVPSRPGRGRGKVGRPRKGKPSARDVAFEVLTKKGAPMALKDLARAVLATGKVKSKSAAFAQNLGMAMREDRRFRKVGRGMYAAGGGRKAVRPSGTKGKRAGRKK